MGIQGLAKLIADNAPNARKESKLETFFGRKVAVDASMHIYQFMVVVGRVGDQLLANEAGEVTSHLQGLFFRTVRMMEEGIKPVFVFDGKPPQLKSEELARRSERRGEATAGVDEAKEAGDAEALEKYSKRTVKVTREQNEDCKRLLKLMGVPIVEAPSEAEAQCVALGKAGLVDYIATEDMDALTFGCPKLARHLMSQTTGPKASNTPLEFYYDKVLEGLGLTAEQFIDVCILSGCDYCGTIKGIGPQTALKKIKEFGSIEKVLEDLATKKNKDGDAKFAIPDPFPYEEARRLFKEPEVLTPENLPPLKWGAPDEEGLVQFMVNEKSFNEDRVRKAVARIKAAKSKATQGRLETFFGPAKVLSSTLKRKEPEVGKGKGKAAAGSKKGKAGSIGGKKK